MPKFYRFRATTPTRKQKRSKPKEENEKEFERLDEEKNLVDLTMVCAPAPYWYLRRTSWRESPPLTGLPREIAAGLRTSLQLNSRPIFVFKIPILS